MKQMTLGTLITILEHKDPKADLSWDVVHFKPCGILSYRGYYDHLAIGYGEEAITVGKFLEKLKECIGKTFSGYKGGDFDMHHDTPLWMANWSESGGTAVVDVKDFGWTIKLITGYIE